MSAGYGYDAELWQFSQQLYPDLPPIEAYLALHRDYVAPMVGPVINGTLTVTEALALWNGPTPWVAKIQGLRLGKKVVERLFGYIKSLCATQQSTAINLTADEKEISAQLTAEIWKRYEAGTLGQPNPFTDGVDTTAAVANVSGESMKNISKGITDNPTSAASASSGPAESLFDRINYLECWNAALRTIQTAQAQRMIKALDVIAEQLGDGNCITVMGASGPDGFARPVYDLVKMKINKVNAADRKNHRFFIYHNSNNWHQAFERLTSENPLPSEFINNPCDDLDHACLFMREVRQKLLAKDEKRGKRITFHLVIPSWSKLQIKEPLHFPEDLYPLQIEGLKHGGQNQVELNLPAAPAGLLHGVSNVLDPNNWNTIAEGAGVAVALPAVGWGVNGACLALSLSIGTLTGAGPLLAIPLWLGTGSFAMPTSASFIQDNIHEALREEDPRVLGSKERLHVPRRRC
ncbi:hypothetical protein ALT_1006 [Aspergillus lentulus]|uniref:Uncharacterized protein n=1 Tax=Aspergillus lentulus TaxID=293939 RepID=A0AAN4PBR6_ASPLE|nr:hypothetical protein CNMCM6069_004135 [Aspergillus lentulus]KAF4168445.1 hypothetical protein CNMCM6936_002540 [Aspergillus lentulus]KAF4178758.1 hypothetical protein CNMCM8060_004189 [Aspergillus lentulus]KAF4188390.1 hypothetical protein CNMCM7927_001596 [Aspergillus lentulus]KAF4196440.1 hypothetical protein CNMCM8694_004800 [Aspergillus lentulus]